MVVKAIAIGLPLYAIFYLSNAPYYLRIDFLSLAYNALFLGLGLVLVFLLVPATKKAPRDRLPWYDLLLVLGGLVTTLYVVVNINEIIVHGALATTTEMVLGFSLLLILSEAVRRTLGWAMVGVAGVFFLYIKFGYLLPSPFYVPGFSWSAIMAYVYSSSQGIFSMIVGIAATIIIIFITFGALLQASGAGSFFINLALSLVGATRGGPAKVAVVASALFGTVSGSATANVGITGSISIPMMKSIGYKPHFAAAVEAVSSTGGLLMPPVMGAVAFILADFADLSYSYVALVATLPAILYFLAIFTQVDFEAAKTGLRGLPRQELPSLRTTLKEGWHFLVPLVLLVVLMMGRQYEPVPAALYAIGATVLVSLLRKETRLTPRRIADGLQNAAQITMEIVPLAALAGVITAAVAITGLGLRLAAMLTNIAGGNLLALALLAALASYVMGMGVSSIAGYILLAILVAPALVALDVPLIVAHLFIYYMTLSTFITPPLCPAVYVASGIARSPPFTTGFQAMRLGIVCYIVPFIFLYNPELLLIGTPVGIALAAVTAIVGVISLASGIEGWLLGRLNWLQRLMFFGAGLAMLVPEWTTDIIGIGIIAGAVLWHWVSLRGVRGERLLTVPLAPVSDEHPPEKR
jgi:TRAP transporter 4TM/12TM fusion protein